MVSCGKGLLMSAGMLGLPTLVVVLLALATDHWTEFTVRNRDLIPKKVINDSIKDNNIARTLYTRHSGIFKECYPGTEPIEFLQRNEDKLVDDYCFETDFDVPEEYQNTIDFSTDYYSRIHLMRCHVAFFAFAILFFLISFIVAMGVCCSRRSKFPYVAAILAFAAAFFCAAGMAFFHGAEYMERSVIRDNKYFFLEWDATLQQGTSRKYGYSYALGWVSMILIAIVAFLYAIAGYYIGKERYRDSPDAMKQMRMREYVTQPPPVIVEPGYVQYDDPRYYYGYPSGPGRGYPGPYYMDMDKGRGGAYPAIANEPKWSWS